MIGRNLEDFAIAPSKTHSPVSKGRLEALSDGLFAIVMTLLVFSLIDPRIAEATTAAELHSAFLELWPKFVGFGITFIIIGVFWVGHHTYFHTISGVVETQLWLNLLFLFCISVLPFSAYLIGEHHNLPTSGILYGLNLLAVIGALRLNWWYAVSRHWVRPDLDPGFIKQMHRRNTFMFIATLLVMAVVLINPVLAFYLYVLNACGTVLSQVRYQTLGQISKPNEASK